MKLIYLLLFISLQAWIANGRYDDLQEEEDSFSTKESELNMDNIKAMEESIYGHRSTTEQNTEETATGHVRKKRDAALIISITTSVLSGICTAAKIVHQICKDTKVGIYGKMANETGIQAKGIFPLFYLYGMIFDKILFVL